MRFMLPKIIVLLISALWFAPISVIGQEKFRFFNYYHQRVSQFNKVPFNTGEIIFLGDSITDHGEWHEFFPDHNVINRGIGGDNTVGLRHRIEQIYKRKPAKVFLMIGVNDLFANRTPQKVAKGVAQILDSLLIHTPDTEIYLQSLLPTRRIDGIDNEVVKAVNVELEKLASEKKLPFINLYPLFESEDGMLSQKYTSDGIHLNGAGYQHWVNQIHTLLVN